jgi:hypothetical protein
LLRCGFEAFVRNVDGEELHLRRDVPSHLSSVTKAYGGSASNFREVDDRKDDEQRSSRIASRVAPVTSGHLRGLRGTSTAEVLQKALGRWRFVIAVEPCWEPTTRQEEKRPSGVTKSLCRIYEEVQTARNLGLSGNVSSGSGVSPQPYSSRNVASSPALNAHTESPHGLQKPAFEEPPHLALLQKTLASFDRITTKTSQHRAVSPVLSPVVVVRPAVGDASPIGFSAGLDSCRSLGRRDDGEIVEPTNLWLSAGHVLASSPRSPGFKQPILPAGATPTATAGLGSPRERSPQSLRRSRLLTRSFDSMPDIAHTMSPTVEDAHWNNGVDSGGVVDLTLRSRGDVHGQRSAPAGHHSPHLRKVVPGRHGIAVEEPEMFGDPSHDLSFVLSAHPEQSSPTDYRDYSTLSRKLQRTRRP